MGTGPAATEPGLDLALTELAGEASTGSLSTSARSGRGLLAEVPHAPAADEMRRARSAVRRRRTGWAGTMEAEGLQELMAASHGAPLGRRRGALPDLRQLHHRLANLLLHLIEDVSELTGEHAERWQRWDSCFDLDFSYLHGGASGSPAGRYRQWLTHKLGTWHDQFGTSGCVGCGRCIIWCPVGIDLTEECKALQAEQDAVVEGPVEGRAQEES